MSDRGWIEPIVERVVGQVLDSQVVQLRGEIVKRVMEEIAAQPAPEAAASSSGTAELARAISEIQMGASQKEILRSLLDGSSRYAARVALFVVKGNHATGWEARGFENCDAVKDFTLDSTAPAVVRATVDRVASSAPSSEFEARFVETFGTPANGEARLLPLILKEKVAALVYADSGSSGKLDVGSLDVLVLATSAWLEVNALRKHAHKEPLHAAAQDSPAPAHAAAPAFNDPFAGHAPAFAMAAAAAGESSAATAAPAPQVVGGAQGAAVEVQAAAAPAPAPEATAEPLPVGLAHVEHAPAEIATQGSPEEQEVHRKAQRFARLLVDEIKLYNQANVAEGKKNKDLYDRLKDTIDKSRITYQKRYGNTVAASGNYFQHELIRSLAEDDITIMGSNFHL